MKALTRRFSDISISDLPEVGGKNSSLGEMYSQLASRGIRIPDGFATTATAFWSFMDENDIRPKLDQILKKLDRENYSNLRQTGMEARELLMMAELPSELKQIIIEEYRHLSPSHSIAVAVRSSATAEDLPEASFAGQHESYLNVTGDEDLLEAVKKCYASLFTDRAIKYREDKGFAHDKIALSVGVQKMVRADSGCSGVAFTLEPESGFRNVIHISGVWGLGENLVQGTVTPDEFLVFKPVLGKVKNPVIQKKLGEKEKTMIYSAAEEKGTVKNIDTTPEKKESFVLNQDELISLATWCLAIEDHYKKPMDIEWAKDGFTGEIFIIQARPETVQSAKRFTMSREYKMLGKGEVLATGQAVGNKIATGRARILFSTKDAGKLESGDIVVTDLTSPDWDPILKNSSAIITNKGGRTSHASIVARELGVPAIVGCQDATEKIKDGEMITVSCAEGKEGCVYRGEVPFKYEEIDFSAIKKPGRTKVMLIVGDPDKAFQYSFYPNDGVGLMRMEFIINHYIQVHPMALVNFNTLKDGEARKQIEKITHHYTDKKKYFIEKLAEGMATIAAAFYPKEVIVRMSDFKTNEYANLVGGKDFEPKEENPMIGFRGASRYYHDLYRDGFALECAAVRMVREDMGLNNVKLMIPFCRTVAKAKKVLEVMKQNGLDRTKDKSLEIYMMAETPSNVLLADKFAEYFDGFSIGSNDLTQLTLGIDRDSSLVSELFSEKDEAAMMMIEMVIDKANSAGIKIGLCGQAPSDDPKFAGFLVKKKITSISFNPDAVIKGIENINMAEKKELIEV